VGAGKIQRLGNISDLRRDALSLSYYHSPQRGSANSLEQVRNSMLMLNRTIVFPRDLQRGSSLG
jgi:hypothetical protein